MKTIVSKLDLNSVLTNKNTSSLPTIELELRELLWFRHGCPSNCLYGDDGEMQCNNIHCHKPIDFKRDSPAEIKNKMMPSEAEMKRVAEKFFAHSER